MNETVRTILARRSVRRFKADPIPEEVLGEIIDCALYAPTSGGKQARHLLVVKNAGVIDRMYRVLAQAGAYDGREPSAGNPLVYGCAPVFMLSSGDPAISTSPEADCSAMLENIMLAAWSHGVGSCWINRFKSFSDNPAVRALLGELGVPAAHTVYGGVCLGYADGAVPEAAARREGTLTVVE